MQGPEDADWMELGETGWVPMPDGTFVNIKSDQMMDEDGNLYTLDGLEIENEIDGGGE